MLDLSIVIPTCNRGELLRKNLQGLLDDVKCGFEVIVVDGASEDETPKVLKAAGEQFGDRLKVIREEKRQGFVRAANKGFAAAGGRNMIWLNDDSRPLKGVLDDAVRQIDAAAANVGFLAMFHRYASPRNCAWEAMHEGRSYRLCHVRGTLYANFPIGRRQTFAALGYFDERFYFYGADPDLSLKAWHAGLRVEPAYGCFIDHDEHADARRQADAARAVADNRKLFAKWNLPEKNPHFNDFNSARPCTLRGLRPPAPKVSFVISTFNRKTALLNTLRQLEELEACNDFEAETIVVDNAGTDGSADAVESQFPGVRLLRQKRNRGACAKNVALPLAGGEYVVFLDDDSYPDAGSISRMIRHFEDDSRLGAAVFGVRLPDGSREASAFPAVCVGCGTGFRREALMAAGGLPKDFFMQAEEYDLSLRILDAGWDVRRFDDLQVTHLKTNSARVPTRTTRLDIRNNLLVIARRFPRRHALPYAMDWIRRYRWMAGNRSLGHRLAFWRGLAEGLAKAMVPGKRQVVSDGAFEKFAMVDEIRTKLSRAKRRENLRSILLIDVGKNLYAYYLAATALKLRIVAIADEKLAREGRSYRGIPIVTDAQAREMEFDGAIVANVSPVQGPQRLSAWRAAAGRPVIDLLEQSPRAIVAAA